jgi:plasminogen activator inhibitor 1 RNA-binding protein
MFSALDSDDDDTPVQKTQTVKTESKAPAASNDKSKGRGGRSKGKGNRSKGKGRGRGKGDREWTPRYDGDTEETGKGKSARDQNRRNRSKGKGTGRGQGGGREYERRDGTGRGREGPKKDGAGRGNWGSTEDVIAEGQAEVAEGPPVVSTENGEEVAVADPVAEEVDDSVSLDAYFSEMKVSNDNDSVRKVDASVFENAKKANKPEEEDFLNLGGGKKKNSRVRNSGKTIFTGVGFKQAPINEGGDDRKGKGKGDRKGKGKGKKGKRENRGNRGGGSAAPNLNDDAAFPSLGN